MMSEALLTIEGTFALAARVGVGDETSIPPIGANIIEKMMNDAVTKRCGDNFTDDGVVNDKSDAATGLIKMTQNTITQVDDIFHGIEFEAVLVDSMFFAFSGGFVSVPEFVEEKPGEATILHFGLFRGRRGFVCCIREW